MDEWNVDLNARTRLQGWFAGYRRFESGFLLRKISSMTENTANHRK
jgi:hypothetical protein